MRGPPAFLLFLSLQGCTSYKADVVTICDAEAASHIGERKDVTAEKRDAFLLEWCAHNVHSQKGSELLGAIAAAGPEGAARARLLRDAARANGVASCALADTWDVPPGLR